MRVKIEFDGSQIEFEQFCQTPQRMAQAQLMQHYQGLLQQPYPIEVEASPVTPALPGQAAGQNAYQARPFLLPAAAGGWEPGTGLKPALPYGQHFGWQHWRSRLQLTGPVKFFLLSLCISIGVVAAVKLRPPTTQATTQPQGQFTLQPIQPAKKATPAPKKGAMPLLPLVPRPGQE
jgi:hypothetical protein